MTSERYIPKIKPLTKDVAKLTRQIIRHSLFKQAFDEITKRDPALPHDVRRWVAREAANKKYRLERGLPEPR